MNLSTSLLSLATGLVIAIGLGGASAGCDDINQAVDCAKICDRYKDCFDDGYDTAACRSTCEDNADQSDAFADKADRCESCIDDQSCAGSFSCVDECIGIVP